MTQVKLFTDDSASGLEQAINEWLSKRPLLSVVDIKYSTDEDFWSALVVYSK